MSQIGALRLHAQHPVEEFGHPGLQMLEHKVHDLKRSSANSRRLRRDIASHVRRIRRRAHDVDVCLSILLRVRNMRTVRGHRSPSHGPPPASTKRAAATNCGAVVHVTYGSRGTGAEGSPGNRVSYTLLEHGKHTITTDNRHSGVHLECAQRGQVLYIYGLWRGNRMRS